MNDFAFPVSDPPQHPGQVQEPKSYLALSLGFSAPVTTGAVAVAGIVGYVLTVIAARGSTGFGSTRSRLIPLRRRAREP
jgi:hypothetical protein